MSINRSSPWRRTTPTYRCPICRHSGWCLVSADGTAAICPRTESPKRCGDAGWLHRLGTPLVGQTTRPAPKPRPSAPRAADVDLDRVYRRLLAWLTLEDPHRRHLLGRGLTDADLARAAYRSLPTGCRAGIVRSLQDRFGDELLQTVPGIIVRENQRGRYLTLAGAPGIVIPVRSAGDHVVGLVLRPDNPGNGGKYRWLSSRPAGPGPGWRVHVPAGVVPRRCVVLTEGALKADVAVAFSGRSIIGLPGCVVTDEAIRTLRALGAEEALLALDADTVKNPHVADAQLEGLRQLKAAGLVEGLVRWPAELGKGLDDMLLTLRRRARQ
jgi:DNA primase